MENALLWILRRMARWPLGRLHAAGTLIGWLAYLLSPTYRRRFQSNARQAGFAPHEVRPAIGEAGRTIAEMPWLWLRPPQQLVGDLAVWDGVEHLEAARAQGKGVLILSPHLGCFEAASQAYAERYGGPQADGRAPQPVTVLYRPARKAFLRRLVSETRGRPGLTAAPTTLAGVRQIIRALRADGAVGLLPDQVPPQDMGVWAPFFGRPAYTMTLAVRLAQQTGATVVLAYCERLPRGRGFRLVFSPTAPGWLEGADAQSAAGKINQAMEMLIRRNPGQYLWGYNRYRTPRSLDAADMAAQQA